MLLIPCPYCGERAEIEFSYGGEAHIARPAQPEALSDAEWANYVYWRRNTKGVAQGCRRWLNVIRDTVSYQILASYEAGTQPPAVERKTYV